jgi:hypothetical protein
MKSIKLLVGAAIAVSIAGAATSVGAQTIDTTPFWDGSAAISSYGGNGGGTGVYGETFTAPGAAITSFTFTVNDEGTAAGIIAQVYAWSGPLTGGNGPQGATGPALFTSAPITTDGLGDFEAIAINTGNTPLTVGQNYIALFADITGDGANATFALVPPFFSHPGVVGDGGFNFYNNDHTLGSINSNVWDDFSDFGSLAYTATFSSGVPEPASWAMMLLGMGAVGFAMRRRETTVVTYA